MDRIALLLTRLGILSISGSLLWWLFFYSGYARTIGIQPANMLSETWPCIVYMTQHCNLLSVAAQMAGYSAYHPILTWVGVGCVLLAILMRERDGGQIKIGE